MIYWDTPCGELYKFNDKSELVKFLNKTQIHFDVEGFSGNDAHGISIRFIPDQQGDPADEFDLLCGDGTYAMEYFEVDPSVDNYCLPIHNPNPYSNTDEQCASVIGHYYGVCSVKEEDVILDERWKFPCNAFIWMEHSGDRLGKLEINLFSVFPIGSERTVQQSQAYEDTHAEKQIDKLKYFIDLENKNS